jgi:hypothetical protein
MVWRPVVANLIVADLIMADLVVPVGTRPVFSRTTTGEACSTRTRYAAIPYRAVKLPQIAYSIAGLTLQELR